MTTNHAAIVDELLSANAGLSDWELEFLTSLQKRLKYGKELTEKQAHHLERVHNEKGKKADDVLPEEIMSDAPDDDDIPF